VKPISPFIKKVTVAETTAMEQTTKLGLLIITITSFIIFLTSSIIFSFHLATENKLVTPFFTPFVRYNEQFVFVLVSLSVFVGALVAFTMLTRLDKTKATAKHDVVAVLRLINPEERVVLETLISSGGRLLQSELSRVQGFNKVKVHRLLMRLKERGVLVIEEHGKTNMVTIEPGLLNTLLP
jgi:uncharacterized membrane protein